MKRVFQAKQNEYGHWLSSSAFAFEVRLSSHNPCDKWRKNHVVLAVAASVEAAIQMAKELYPHDPIVDQVILRNNNMDLIISGDLIANQETEEE